MITLLPLLLIPSWALAIDPFLGLLAQDDSMHNIRAETQQMRALLQLQLELQQQMRIELDEVSETIAASAGIYELIIAGPI